jgi:hypothetical protein
MELRKIKHYLRKVSELGIQKSATIAYNRWQEKRFDLYWRAKANKQQANHAWHDVQKQFALDETFALWHEKNAWRITLDTRDVCPRLDQDDVLMRASEFCEHSFCILGSEKKKFENIPWHHDIRLAEYDENADSYFDPQLYYKDFVITPGTTAELKKDIKVPWELARLQHFFVLGHAYQDSPRQAYARAFERQFLDWHTKNPFLLGSHWACPMDVGIRAVNLVWGYNFFKNALPASFWESYVCSLYDHFFYLEHNWEVYDFRTSNHYLSDLIGYLYLCYFFFDNDIVKKKAAWCYQTLLDEFEKQVLGDGTDYEGSASYHQLVTEIFFHTELLANKMGFIVPETFKKKLTAMIAFIDACKPHGSDETIQIGDNDSGKILFFGVTRAFVENNIETSAREEITHYKNFGISIFKNHDWHISLRHHVYDGRQPSGHFHADVASVTVAYKNIPIIVDPGSYLYTPSSVWRNRFRDASYHSIFQLYNQPTIMPDERLFLLSIPEQQFCDSWQTSEDGKTLYTFHALYKALGITAHRSVTVNDARVIITDWFESSMPDEYAWEWHFMLHPSMLPMIEGDHIILNYGDKNLSVVTSSIQWHLEDAWYSPGYGVKMPTKKLYGCVNLHPHAKIVTTFSML